jgi:hypothetical protein
MENSVYDHRNPDYVYLAAVAVRCYYAKLAKDAEYMRELSEEAAVRKQAAEAFAAWDGRITEAGE